MMMSSNQSPQEQSPRDPAAEAAHKSLASDNIISGRAQEISISDLLVHQPGSQNANEQSILPQGPAEGSDENDRFN